VRQHVSLPEPSARHRVRSTSIFAEGATLFICLATPNPFMSGRLMSKRITSGCSSKALLTDPAPFPTHRRSETQREHQAACEGLASRTRCRPRGESELLGESLSFITEEKCTYNYRCRATPMCQILITSILSRKVSSDLVAY
jgi:hypothetical protein